MRSDRIQRRQPIRSPAHDDHDSDEEHDSEPEYSDHSMMRRSWCRSDHLDSSRDSQPSANSSMRTESYVYERTVKLSSTSQLNSSTEFEASRNLSKLRNTSVSVAAAPPAAKPTNSNTVLWTVIGLVAVIVAAGAYAWLLTGSGRPKQQCTEFDELRKQFPNQDSIMWKSFRKGVEDVLNNVPQRPSTFLLAYHDPTTSDRLMEQILNATAHCMHASDTLKLDGNEIGGRSAAAQSHGDIIAMYERPLKATGIMYVADIGRIAMPTAQMFHVICDTVTPLVARAVIFLTLHIERYERNMAPRHLLRLVEEELERNWHANATDSNENILEALIARVTDQLFLVHPEKRLL